MATHTHLRPPWAVTCWHDNTFIYVELPGTDPSQVYITKYDYTAEGLSKVLQLLKRREVEVPKAGFEKPGNGHKTVMQPRRSRKPIDVSKPPVPKATDGQMESARSVLRKLGMIK